MLFSRTVNPTSCRWEKMQYMHMSYMQFFTSHQYFSQGTVQHILQFTCSGDFFLSFGACGCKIIVILQNPQDNIFRSENFIEKNENIDKHLMFILPQPNEITYSFCKKQVINYFFLGFSKFQSNGSFLTAVYHRESSVVLSWLT